MRLDERSYSGTLFRPRPEIHYNPTNNLLLIASPWGARSTAQRAIQIIESYIVSAQQDLESTTPYAQVNSQSTLMNHIRIAVKLANDSIYHAENKSEYTSGIELLALTKQNSEIAWIQIGHPYLILDRPQKNFVPLGSMQDLSMEWSSGTQSLSPLPNKLLGLDPQLEFSAESFRLLPHDRLICISRSHLPSGFYSLSSEERNLESISTLLSKDDFEMPFWIGVLG